MTSSVGEIEVNINGKFYNIVINKNDDPR